MWQKYVEKTNAIEPILKSYLKMRRLFQSYDWSDSDLAKPPFYSREMMILRDEILNKITRVGRDLSLLGFEDINLSDYLAPFFSKIDELTPLKNGNTERTDTRDEDNK